MSLLSGVTLFTFSLSLLKSTNILEGISIGHFFIYLFIFLLLAFYHLSRREAPKAAALPSGPFHKVSFPVKLEPADQMLQADSIADSSG